MKALIKNPFTQWLWWLAKTSSLKRRHPRQHLDIGYMAMVNQSTFGNYNRVSAGAMLHVVSMGDMSYVGERSRLSHVKVGKFCCIGPEVLAGLGKHPTHDYISSHPAFYSPHRRAGRNFVREESFDEFAPIEIGHDVWIGARAVLLDGISIGTGSIVGAGAVVVGDIPPYSVAVGIPARVVRKRFSDRHIAMLLQSAWWDMEMDALERHVGSFSSVEYFEKMLAAGAGIE